MKVLFNFTFLLLFMSFSTISQGQRNCGSMDVLDRQIKENPALIDNMEEIERQVQEYIKHHHGDGERTIITIPTVFHVVYRTSSENISDAQIMSQLDVLNQDYSATNTDISNVPSTFSGLVANAEVQFCLATQDPNGAATTGITRKSTTKTSWGTNDSVKKSSQGGVNPWDASNYLNIWVCNIGGGILGYAQFPGGSAATDGVVLDYRYTGTTGTATAPFDKGRTATHEVGHWLNLRHIWGDATCGSDLVSDTPTHNTSNYGCPSHPHYSTCSGSPIEMTMNYMDYTDDACMYMLSLGQKTRLRAVLETGGARASLQSSPGCSPPSVGSCGTPSGLAASSVTSSSATCSWTPVSGSTNYTFEYKLSSASTWITSIVSTTSINLTGLTASSTYNIRVKATCSGTTSAYSTTVNFTTSASTGCTDIYESNNTKSAAKTIPLGTTFTAKISSSTDVDWFKFNNSSSQKNVRVSMTNLPADYDMILYRGNSQVGISQNDATSDEQITYNNTKSATTYYVKVYGYNGANSANCYDFLAQISASSFRTINGEVSDDGLNAELVQDEFLIFPNPASTEITMVIPFGEHAEGKLTISDITGKTIVSQQMCGDRTLKTISMDVSEFNGGLYIINFRSGDKSYTQKLVIADRK
ncbi:MAG: M43 family zinc metalloprotease [Saprospiraceae bacterium]